MFFRDFDQLSPAFPSSVCTIQQHKPDMRRWSSRGHRCGWILDFKLVSGCL